MCHIFINCDRTIHAGRRKQAARGKAEKEICSSSSTTKGIRKGLGLVLARAATHHPMNRGCSRLTQASKQSKKSSIVFDIFVVREDFQWIGVGQNVELAGSCVSVSFLAAWLVDPVNKNNNFLKVCPNTTEIGTDLWKLVDKDYIKSPKQCSNSRVPGSWWFFKGDMHGDAPPVCFMLTVLVTIYSTW